MDTLAPQDPQSDPPPIDEPLPFLPKRKKFLIPVIILLAITIIGLVAGVLIGFSSIKRSEPFKLTTAELAGHEIVRQTVGTPFDTGWLVIGKYDERNGTYDLTFTIDGPGDQAAVRARCERETDESPWEVTFLDIGVGGRDGDVYTLVGDPDDPPGRVRE